MAMLKLTNKDAMIKACESVVKTRCEDQCRIAIDWMEHGGLVVKLDKCHGYEVCVWNRIEDDANDASTSQ